jgi:hypothetical protein
VLHAALDGPAPVLEAAHDGYRVLPDRPVHHRTWRLSDERLELRDVVSGTPGARHRAEVVFHLAPGFRAHADGHRLFVESGSRAFLLDARGSGHWELRHGDVVVGVPASTVAGAGRRVHALAAAFVSTGSLPLSVLTVVEVLPEPGTRPAGRRAARVPAGAGRQAGQC